MADKFRASYDNPNGKHDGERVVAIGQCAIGLMVQTEHMGTHCTYYGVKDFRHKVGDIVNGKIKSTAMRIRPRAWSPFDGQDED